MHNWQQITTLTPANSFKVLEKIGLADFVTKSSPQLTRFCDRASYGEDLGMSYLPSEFKERYGQPGAGVKRATLNLALKDALDTLKIQVREGWHLEKIIENEESVIAVSQDGQRIEGSFLIGCDGVKAISRNLILQQHGMQEGKPSYTGIMVVSIIRILLDIHELIYFGADSRNITNPTLYPHYTRDAQCVRPGRTHDLLPHLPNSYIMGHNATRPNRKQRDLAPHPSIRDHRPSKRTPLLLRHAILV